MPLPPAKRIDLEDRLSKLAPRLKDAPLQAGTLIAQAVERAGLHITDIKIVFDDDKPPDDGIERMRWHTRRMERWQQLINEVGNDCKWDVLIHACATKVDLQAKWRPIIMERLGVDGVTLQVKEHVGYVPYDWLEKVLAMADLDPNEYNPRSNYADVCEPLESTLRGAGKTPGWIAKTLTDFIARFNGRHITVVDVRFPKGQLPATRR